MWRNMRSALVTGVQTCALPIYHHLPVGLGFNKQHPPPHQLRRGIKNKEIKKYQRFPHSKLLKSNHKSIDLHRLVTNYSLHYDNIRKLSGGIIYKPEPQ